MKVDLTKAVDAILSFRPGEWYSPDGERASKPILIRVVSVGQEMTGGLVLAHGHKCNVHNPDCGDDYCWEGQLLVSAVREELDCLP